MSQWGNKDYANNVPKFLNTNHPGNTNVYLVDSGRLANASFGGGKAVAHQGWVKVKQGTGFVTGISVSNTNPALKYANTYVSFIGANTRPANAQLLVTGAAQNVVSVFMIDGGEGYASVPSVRAAVANSNNSTLIFTLTTGGRIGRVQAETLVALSEPVVTDANSGLPYFTGA